MSTRSTWRRAVAGTLAATVAVALAACGDDDDKTPAQGASTAKSESSPSLNGKSAAILSSANNAFNNCMNKAAATALEKAGLEVSTLYSDFKPATSTSNLQDVVTKRTDGVAYMSQLAPLDKAALAKLADTPTVYYLGPPVNGATPAATMPADGVAAGKTAVEELLRLKPDTKNVALIPGVPGFPIADDTLAGWQAALKAGGIKPVAVSPGDFTSPTGAKITADLLQKHPDLDAIVTVGDDMALAAARAVRTSGKSVEVAVTYGFSKAALAAVSSGQLLSIVYAPVEEWGVEVADALVAALENKPGPSTVELKLKPIDKSTVGSVSPSC